MFVREKANKSNFANLNNYFTSNPKNNQKKKSLGQKNKKKSGQKNKNNFEKITGSGDINVSGSQPKVIFKKQSNKKISKSPNPLNSKYTINKTKFEYVSDGGMAQKIQKYNSNNNISKNNNLYYYNNYISNKDHNLPNNKNKKNTLDKKQHVKNNEINKQNEQILSKTVREFKKRPLIINNKDINKEQETNNKSKNSLDEKKIHKGKQNIIKNSKLYNKVKNEDSKEQEEQKIIKMKQLVENGVVNELKKLEKKMKIQKKDNKIERKKEVLENQGLPLNYFNEEDEEERKAESYNHINNNNDINYLNRQFMSKSTRGFYPKINKYLFPLEKNNNEEYNMNHIKEKKKPSINQFEFINKINSEKKK